MEYLTEYVTVFGDIDIVKINDILRFEEGLLDELLRR